MAALSPASQFASHTAVCHAIPWFRTESRHKLTGHLLEL